MAHISNFLALFHDFYLDTLNKTKQKNTGATKYKYQRPPPFGIEVERAGFFAGRVGSGRVGSGLAKSAAGRVGLRVGLSPRPPL